MITLRQYTALSWVTTAAVVYHAFATRRHFYPATLQLSTSKLAIATISNFSFAMALCCYRLIIKVFLGTLRDIELEKINERLSSAIMETCLALTIFRDEFNLTFLAMFALLAFIKVFHWLVQDRVEYMEVTPNVSTLQHIRIVAFMFFLLALDSCFLSFTIANVLKSGGQSVHVLFAFEYVIQASSIISLFIKYVFFRVDSLMGGRWENKGTYVFYLELITDMVHLLVYCGFFVIVFTHYGLPLHLIRDLYMTFRNFRTRISDFLRFRQVTARMDRFPDASPEDLQRCHGVCIICREEMAPANPNKKLHCGHVFHLHCLRSWLERQQNCPTCRANVFRPNAGREPGTPRADGAQAAGGGGAQQGAAGPAAAQGGPPPAQPPAPGQGAGATSTPPQAPHLHQPHPPPGWGTPRSTPPATHAPGQGGPLSPGAYWAPPTIPAGYAWQVPQWYPVTSMAAFPSPLQYAGQQSADALQGLAAMMPAMMPFLPGLPPPFTPVIPAPPPTATPEEQHLHAQAAAAAMAAAAAAMYTPLASLVMMPPTTLFNPAAVAAAAAAAAAAPPATGPSTSAGGAGTSTSIAGAGGSHQAATAAALGASMQATQSLLQQHLDYIQRLRDGLAAPPAGGSEAGPSSSSQAAGPSTSSSATATAVTPPAGGEPAEEDPEVQQMRRRLAVVDRPDTL